MLNKQTTFICRLFFLSVTLIGFSIPNISQALPNPKLNFSDLITGPDSGLGDGQGSGVIVTIWGQNLGSSQGNSSITFIDSGGNYRTPVHVYYWKNADGKLPGGPANLYESHKMQEIAFSIPNSDLGTGQIKVTVNSKESNSLPFTVRTGNIYHIKANGEDSNDGSFKNPWRTVSKGDSTAVAGDTLYIHNVETGGPTTSRAIYNNKGFTANETNQMAYVAYPGTRPTVTGGDAVHVYLTTGIVTSKLDVYTSNCDSVGNNCFQTSANGIMPSAHGRVVGNAITDQPGGCANSQAGAISGGRKTVEGSKIYGNYVYDYSCPEASKLHHTTYMTIRSAPDDLSISAWEWGWNHLTDNHAKNGIHNYDEDNSGKDLCGDLTSDLLIHDNVIVNQAGAGITIESMCGWSQDTYIYNNVLINVGLKSDINCTFNCGQNGSGITVGDGGLLGNIYIYNNTIHTWDSDNLENQGSSTACISVRGDSDNVDIFVNDNICHTTSDKYFIGNFLGAEKLLDNFSGNNNIWYYINSNPKNAVAPQWDRNPIKANPLLSIINGTRVDVGYGSSAIDKVSNGSLLFDVYGMPRVNSTEVGSVEYYTTPSAPTLNTPR